MRLVRVRSVRVRGVTVRIVSVRIVPVRGMRVWRVGVDVMAVRADQLPLSGHAADGEKEKMDEHTTSRKCAKRSPQLSKL